MHRNIGVHLEDKIVQIHLNVHLFKFLLQQDVISFVERQVIESIDVSISSFLLLIQHALGIR